MPFTDLSSFFFNTVVIRFFRYLALISSIYCKYELWLFMPNQYKVNNNNNNNNIDNNKANWSDTVIS